MSKYISIIFLFVSITAMGQMGIKRAETLYKEKAYIKAAKVYDDLIADGVELKMNNILQAADSHYFINEAREASELYKKVRNSNGTLDPQYLQRYYRALREIREYAQADDLMKDYFREINDKQALADYERDKANFELMLNDTTPSRYTLTEAGVNTEFSDFAPVKYKGKIIFSSSRPGASKDLYAWNNQPYLSLYIADTLNGGRLSNPKLFSKQISSDYHDATLAFIPDTTTVYFTSSNVKKKKLVLDDSSTNHFELYKGTMVDNRIENKEGVFFNSPDYSNGHPAISADGKYLFFASDMPGGYGGADIYYCEIYSDGTLSTPKNVGPTINTWGNDFFPHVAEGKLYFASDGRIGFGGLDIYESTFDESDKTFSEALNLGKTINSVYDDFAYVLNDDLASGYMSSNRVGGKGDDDIYHFNRAPLPCDQFVTGVVRDLKTSGGLGGVSLTARDASDNIVHSTFTNDNGEYELSIPCDEEVFVTAEKDDYFAKTFKLKTGSDHLGKTDPLDFTIENAKDRIVEENGIEKIKMDPIYFDYDKSDVTTKAAETLNYAVELMNFYPEMVIKIEAHTDSRGSKGYNESLSDRRAKATRDYIFSQGIDQNRIISAIGYGEAQLLNKCADGVKCTEEEHSVNRRSDFIIVNEKKYKD